LVACSGGAAAFGTRITVLDRSLAAEPAVLKVRLHRPEPDDNAEPAPSAPNVDHSVSSERRLIADLQLVFGSPLEWQTFSAFDAFGAAAADLREYVAHAPRHSRSAASTPTSATAR
jgi:hypothetical protein